MLGKTATSGELLKVFALQPLIYRARSKKKGNGLASGSRLRQRPVLVVTTTNSLQPLAGRGDTGRVRSNNYVRCTQDLQLGFLLE